MTDTKSHKATTKDDAPEVAPTALPAPSAPPVGAGWPNGMYPATGTFGYGNIVQGEPAPLTATAGIPGTWDNPAGNIPANAAAANTAGTNASPATVWTVGQYVQGSTAGAPGEMYWNGTTWVAGRKT